MLGSNVWRKIIGVDRGVVIEDVEGEDDEEVVVVHLRLRKDRRRRCGRCKKRAPGYDQGEGRRRWRSLDLGTLRCYLEADAPRVNCKEHGPTVALVPWARHAAGHTRAFDDRVSWLVTHTAKSTVCELMRVAWRSVGAIIDRVVTDASSAHDPFNELFVHDRVSIVFTPSATSDAHGCHSVSALMFESFRPGRARLRDVVSQPDSPWPPLKTLVISTLLTARSFDGWVSRSEVAEPLVHAVRHRAEGHGELE